jgi:hypothetical protein
MCNVVMFLLGTLLFYQDSDLHLVRRLKSLTVIDTFVLSVCYVFAFFWLQWILSRQDELTHFKVTLVSVYPFLAFERFYVLGDWSFLVPMVLAPVCIALSSLYLAGLFDFVWLRGIRASFDKSNPESNELSLADFKKGTFCITQFGMCFRPFVTLSAVALVSVRDYEDFIRVSYGFYGLAVVAWFIQLMGIARLFSFYYGIPAGLRLMVLTNLPLLILDFVILLLFSNKAFVEMLLNFLN